jgi:hypothetical protein
MDKRELHQWTGNANVQEKFDKAIRTFAKCSSGWRIHETETGGDNNESPHSQGGTQPLMQQALALLSSPSAMSI